MRARNNGDRRILQEVIAAGVVTVIHVALR